MVVRADGAARGVGVGAGDRGVQLHIQAGDGLSERRIRIEVGIGDAAITRPEAGVDGELRKISEGAHLPCAIRFAARQLANGVRRSTCLAPIEAK